MEIAAAEIIGGHDRFHRIRLEWARELVCSSAAFVYHASWVVVYRGYRRKQVCDARDWNSPNAPCGRRRECQSEKNGCIEDLNGMRRLSANPDRFGSSSYNELFNRPRNQDI